MFKPYFSGLVGLFFLVFCTSVYSQEINWVKAPERGEITHNIHFIIDKSLSMSPGQVKRAIDLVLELGQYARDEMNIALSVFGDDWHRWRGKDEESGESTQWMRLPSAYGLEALQTWLMQVPVRDRASDIRAALEAALKEKKKDLTVIILSDGEFNFVQEVNRGIGFIAEDISSQQLMWQVRKAQKFRKQKDLFPSRIGI